MINFKKAIEVGLRNAEAAESANNEIDDVIAALTQAVDSASDGKVTLARVANTIDDRLPHSIELRTTTAPARAQLIATYQVSADGYPVAVAAFGHRLSAGDAESLRQLFETLFERSEVGRYLRDLMRNE